MNIVAHDEKIIDTLKTNLKQLRIERKMNPSIIAKVLGISRQGYMNYESGDRIIPTVALIKLSEFYNIPIDSIIENRIAINVKNKVQYRTYLIDSKIKKVIEGFPTTISNQDDFILVKEDSFRSLFFWRSNGYHENRLILFSYYDELYISNIYFNHKNGGGFFFINNKAVFFDKSQEDKIVYIGVLAGVLSKEFVIKNFF